MTFSQNTIVFKAQGRLRKVFTQNINGVKSQQAENGVLSVHHGIKTQGGLRTVFYQNTIGKKKRIPLESKQRGD